MKKTQFRIVFLAFFLIVLLGFSSIGAAQIGVWTQKTDMPAGRETYAVCSVRGKIYAIGGWMSGAPSTARVEEYDPITDIWTRKADLPKGLQELATSVVDGKIYAFGGIYDTFGPNMSIRSEVYEYDPVADEWTRKTDMPTARSGLSTSVVDGNIYAIGGINNNYTAVSTVEMYDPMTDTWTRKADMPTAREGLSTSTANGQIYAIGGHISNGAMAFLTVEIYDPVKNAWTVGSDMYTPRVAFSTSVANGKIYAIGGYTQWLGGGTTGLSTVEIYDPAIDTWSNGPEMLTARGILGSASANGKIYAIGGWSSKTLFSVVEELDTGFGIQVTTISLQEGIISGSESIAIIGSGFRPSMTVTIGGNSVKELSITDTLIKFITPSGMEGEQNIWIFVPELDESVFVGTFFYKPLSDIVVTTIMPTNGKQAGGDMGSITGNGFLPGATVTIGGNPAADVGVTSALITFKIPPGTAGAKDVVVTNPNGQKDTLRNAYTYNPFPVIKKLSPFYGGPLRGGTEIIITGSHFMEDVVVAIGENQARKPDFFSPTELRLRTPPDEAGMKAVKVINPDGQEAIMEEGFTYNPAPTISSINPDAGSLEGGRWITIIGTGFIYPDVLIGGVEVSTHGRLSTNVTALTPPSTAGVKDVTVVNPDGQRATLKTAFTYNPAPVITGVTPNNGKLAGGTEITIHGSGFLTGAKVLISINKGSYKTASSIAVMSSSIITAVTPPGKSGGENVMVFNSDSQVVVLPDGFTYNPLPTITSITPNYGSSTGGTKIAIAGTGFLQGARVMIGENAANTQLRDDTAIEAIAPSLPQGVWDVRVVNPDTQEVVMTKGFISVGEVAYNYPNPFRASQGTTFRYVTGDPVQSITVKIFNLAGVPIDVVQQTDSNEVKWHNAEIHAGLYVYLMEIELENGKMKQFRSVLEVRK